MVDGGGIGLMSARNTAINVSSPVGGADDALSFGERGEQNSALLLDGHDEARSSFSSSMENQTVARLS